MNVLSSPFNLNATRRKIVAWLAALIAGVALIVLGIGGDVEIQFQNLRSQTLEKPASGDIVIAEIDAKSLQALDSWPWPRRYYGQAIEKLSAAGATQISFDIDFSAHSSAAEDQFMAEAIAASDAAIIMATFRQAAGAGNDAFVESLPIPILRENTFLASVNVHPDKRGQLNSYSYGTVTGGQVRPSLASQLADSSGNIDDSFAIDQSIDPATIPRISFVDILSQDNLSSAVKGKKILIGATAIELGDRYPISRFGVLPGVVIQAMAAETLLQSTNMVNIGSVPTLLVVSIILLALIIRKNTLPSMSICFVLGIGIFTTLIFVEWQGWFTFSNVPALAFLAVFLIVDKFLRTDLALNNSRFFNGTSKLPNEAAFRHFVQHIDGPYFATVHLADFHELNVVTDQVSRADLFQNIAARLQYLAAMDRIFHIDSDTLAWVLKEEHIQNIDGHFETAMALFHAPFMAGETKIKLKVTFGISDESIGKSKAASEQALDVGKKWMWHDDEVADAIGQKQNLLVELDEAIQNEDISVVYQPKWSLPDSKLNGAEALVRWCHPERGMISPEIFIPLLEKAEQMDDLTLYVLNQALKRLSKWEMLQPGLECSVNVSAQLLSDSKFVEKTIQLVDAAPIKNGQIIFEVTETATLDDPDLSILALTRIREAGIKVSIDDYGTGQSTMSYLQRLPADEIKIDQSFVKTITTVVSNRVMVKSAIEMAHALGFKVVAEGIEDQPCLDMLTSMGCDVGQGWHISKPIDPDTFEMTWLGSAVSGNRKSA